MGNNLASLDNMDLVVDLTNNNISILLEAEFKPYFEKRKENGYCVLQVRRGSDCLRSIIPVVYLREILSPAVVR